jgi:hypothetical protein
VAILTRLLARLNLRFPTLFTFFALLTLLDLVLPDPIPFADELGLALLTLLLGLWRERRSSPIPRADSASHPGPNSGVTGHARPRPRLTRRGARVENDD